MAGPENLNTLGAPAEGFGQNVTFAFAPDPRDLSRSQALGVELVRAGQQGRPVAGQGFTPAGAPPQAQMDPALAGLFKVADAIADRNIKKARQENFFKGMQMAQQGAAVADLIKDQPPWASIMGDSDVVEGARAWTQNAKVAQTVTDWELKLPELRQMPAEQVQKFLNDSVNSSLTGDAATDAAMLQAYSRHMPAFLKTQAKEHYGWQQEKAYSDMTGSFYSTAKQLQTQFTNPTRNEEEREALNTSFFAGLVPPDRMNPQTWVKGVLSVAARLGEEGSLIPLRAIRNGLAETDGGKIFGQENFARLDNMLQQAAQQSARKFRDGPEYLKFMQDMEAKEQAGIAAGDTELADKLYKDMVVFDATNRNLLGLGDTPIVSNMEIMRQQSSVRAAFEAQRRADIAERKEAAKLLLGEQQEAANAEVAKAAFFSGVPAMAKGLKNWNDTRTSEVISNLVVSSGLLEPQPVNTEVGQKVVAAWQLNAKSPHGDLPNHIKQTLASQMTQALAAKDPAQLLPSVYNTALNFVDGQSAGDRFLIWKKTYGEENAARLERMYSAQGGQRMVAEIPPLHALMAAQDAPKPMRSYPEKERELLTSAIDELDRTLLGRVFGFGNEGKPAVEIRPLGRDVLAGYLAPRLKNSLAPTEAAAQKASIADVLSSDVEIVGGYPVVGGRGRIVENIRALANQAGIMDASDTLAINMDKAIVSLLEQQGMDANVLSYYANEHLVFMDPATNKVVTMPPESIVSRMQAHRAPSKPTAPMGRGNSYRPTK